MIIRPCRSIVDGRIIIRPSTMRRFLVKRGPENPGKQVHVIPFRNKNINNALSIIQLVIE
ncbi:MAG: hypothetical protein LBE22_00695 [Azoarcus sp.]|jgi:hypothetical protein|nr:hypothetical protein [Azoarcus sp.]